MYIFFKYIMTWINYWRKMYREGERVILKNKEKFLNIGLTEKSFWGSTKLFHNIYAKHNVTAFASIAHFLGALINELSHADRLHAPEHIMKIVTSMRTLWSYYCLCLLSFEVAKMKVLITTALEIAVVQWNKFKTIK